eukprot:798227-Pyramimonas_sp.AAC.1
MEGQMSESHHASKPWALRLYCRKIGRPHHSSTPDHPTAPTPQSPETLEFLKPRGRKALIP